MRLILLIEDDKDIRDSVSEVLEVEGFKVVSAANGQEGLEYLRSPGSARPDVILLDLMMPVLNGMQFRTLQLSDSKFANIPVIVMSADNRALLKAEEMKSTRCILKPLDIADLLSVIESVLA